MNNKNHSGIGTASLILGILGLVFMVVSLVSMFIFPWLGLIIWVALIFGIIAIILGAVAYWGQLRDKFGLYGFILGLLTVILTIVLTIVIAATVYVYVSGMVAPGPEMGTNIAFMKSDDSLIVTHVSPEDSITWSEIEVTGSCTYSHLTGYVREGDTITDCSGGIQILDMTQNQILGYYYFSS